jgi:adenylylsulfate kinase-like enzyme
LAKLIWITGLSGSGKTTIGREVYERLKSLHVNTIFLDGDSFREIMGNDLGHTPQDRFKIATRIHKMCKFLVLQNINVVCATMSLFKEIHELNREEIEDYYEIFIECSMEELIKRDQKGLYSEAIAGKRDDVVGVNLPFDKPKNCNLIIDNSEKVDLDKKAKMILDLFVI